MTQWLLRLVWKNMAVITRWSYKRGGRKAGFHCIWQIERVGIIALKFQWSRSPFLVSFSKPSQSFDVVSSTKTFYRSVLHIEGNTIFLDSSCKELCSFCFQGLESCIHLEELSVENNCISKFEGNFKDSLNEPCPYQAVTNCYSFNFPRFCELYLLSRVILRSQTIVRHSILE